MFSDPKTYNGLIIANNTLNLLCIYLKKADPSMDSKWNVLTQTATFPNLATHSECQITIIVEFYVFGIPVVINSNKGCCFENEIM